MGGYWNKEEEEKQLRDFMEMCEQHVPSKDERYISVLVVPDSLILTPNDTEERCRELFEDWIKNHRK